MPGDSKDFIRRIMIQALQFFWKVTQAYELNTRRLGLTLIPKVVMAKTTHADLLYCKYFFGGAIVLLNK